MKKLFTFLFLFIANTAMMFAEVYSGTCGADSANIRWSLDDETGRLVLTGRGAMADWERGKTPWFAHKAHIRRVDFQDGITSIGNAAFAGCTHLDSVLLPNSVISIGETAFEECTGLATLSLSDSLRSIGGSAFFQCTSLYTIELPEGITEIPIVAFGYSGLETVWLPRSLQHIGYGAFIGCNQLTGIHLPANVSEIEDMAFTVNVTTDDNQLLIQTDFTEITVDPQNPYFTSLDGVLYDKNLSRLVAYPAGRKGTYQIPVDIQEISAYAFYGNMSVTQLTLPSSVLTLGEGALMYCDALESLTCEALVPPSSKSDFGTESDSYGKPVSYTLYVPASSMEAYKSANYWRKINDVRPITAATVVVEEVTVEPTGNTVVIEWPEATGATEYTITISKSGETVCTLTFDEDGQLLDITYAAPARLQRDRYVSEATQTNTGWQYVISGLEPGVQYEYSITAKNEEQVLYETKNNFTTPISTDYRTEIGNTPNKAVKILHNGQFFILRNGHTYTTTGQEQMTK